MGHNRPSSVYKMYSNNNRERRRRPFVTQKPSKTIHSQDISNNVRNWARRIGNIFALRVSYSRHIFGECVPNFPAANFPIAIPRGFELVM